MGHYEDLYWEVHTKLEELNLSSEFSKQLKKMDGQRKHKYKSHREKWEYAFARVTGSSLPYIPKDTQENKTKIKDGIR
jgi:hypothetical protein